MLLEPNEVYSSVAGWICVACWVIVLMPQMYKNYKRKSSDSLSLSFIVIWLAGDVFNFVGSFLQHLLTTMIALAGYYVLADIVLVWQIFYYRKRSVTEEHTNGDVIATDELTPLVNRQDSSKHCYFKEVMTLLAQVIGVCVTGVVAYLISEHAYGDVQKRPGDDRLASVLGGEPDGTPYLSMPAQIFGWASALLYLGSRIPQIYKNYKNKSCEGLALGMFAFAVLGNVSYVLSIWFHSTDPTYLLINLSWLVGSGGTLVFDFIIFAQFYMYNGRGENDVTEAAQSNQNANGIYV